MKLIAQELKRHFNPNELDKIARETGFIKRRSELTAKDFVFLFVFSDVNVILNSLSCLCSKLEAETMVSLSNNGLDKRINKAGVRFLQKLFTSLLHKKLCPSANIPSFLGDYFNRIRILDSTVFQLPNIYKEKYKGSGGSSSEAGIKIQLEYELKSGDFMHIETSSGKDSDSTYGSELIETVEEGDLCIRDLGYFCIKDFSKIEELNACYLSRLKMNVNVYKKNDKVEYHKNGKVQKKSLYKKVDLKEIMDNLKLGKTIELDDVYIGGGNEKLKTRLVIYKLTDKQLKERLKKNAAKERRKGIKYKEDTKKLMGINLYITNIPKNIAPKDLVHDIYSLRWQVEIIFKIWKSIFDLDKVKSVKIERFECHLYGKLIAIMICSSLAFQMRYILLQKKKKEMSEFKSIGILKEYLSTIYNSLADSLQNTQQILLRIFKMIGKNGLKSHRKKKKTVFDILIVFPELDNPKKMVA